MTTVPTENSWFAACSVARAPLVGEFEAEHIRARSIMGHVLYYFVDESANTVTIVDVAHPDRATARERYEGG